MTPHVVPQPADLDMARAALCLLRQAFGPITAADIAAARVAPPLDARHLDAVLLLAPNPDGPWPLALDVDRLLAARCAEVRGLDEAPTVFADTLPIA